MIRCRRCKSPVPPSFSFPGACHVAPAPRGLWVTRLRLHAARQTSTEDYSGGNKQTRLSQSLSGTHRQQRGASNEATDGTGLCTDTQTHTCTWTALNPLQFPSWSSRGILDCVKDIMGQIEMMRWEGCVSTCVYVCGWLIDEMLSLRRVSVMMTITRGGELRQLWLLGIQIGVLTGLLLKFVFFPPHFSFFGRAVSGCDSHCLLLYFPSWQTTSLLFLHQLVSCRSSLLQTFQDTGRRRIETTTMLIH